MFVPLESRSSFISNKLESCLEVAPNGCYPNGRHQLWLSSALLSYDSSGSAGRRLAAC